MGVGVTDGVGVGVGSSLGFPCFGVGVGVGVAKGVGVGVGVASGVGVGVACGSGVGVGVAAPLMLLPGSDATSSPPETFEFRLTSGIASSWKISLPTVTSPDPVTSI